MVADCLSRRRGTGRGSDMYTSNTLVRAACRAGGGRYLFGASVHPYRENAIACVDEVFAAGACLMKWMPLHQNIDCRDERTKTVLRRCAEIGLPLLLHCGPEFTLATQHREYESVEPLLDALRELRRDGCMPTVIVGARGDAGASVGLAAIIPNAGGRTARRIRRRPALRGHQCSDGVDQDPLACGSSPACRSCTRSWCSGRISPFR